MFLYGGRSPPYKYMIKYMAVAVAVAVGGGGAVAVAAPIAGLTKRFFNHIQKDFLINVWGYIKIKKNVFFVFRFMTVVHFCNNKGRN